MTIMSELTFFYTFRFTIYLLQNNARGQDIPCCPAYILLSHTDPHSRRVQILYIVVQWYTWEYRWQYAIICSGVYTVVLELVASSSSSPSCFSCLVPCGVLVWFLQQGVHLAVQSSLRIKYPFSPLFLPLHAQSRVFRLVLWWFCVSVSDRVRQAGVRTSTAPVEQHRVCIYIWKQNSNSVQKCGKNKKSRRRCSLKKKDSLLWVSFVTLPWRRWQKTHL